MGLENETLGKYEIVREIGRGNMATVYLAHDPFDARDVAIKVAHPENLGDDQAGKRYRKMFFNEAKVAGMLKHPNTVAIYDAGVEGETCYIAMEYVPGGATLKEHCRPDRLLPVEDVAQIVFKCARALDHAHRRGVVHRDIKPGNVLLTPDHDVKIVDFGIAMLTRSDATGTQVHGYVGSPLYMSPEQVQQDAVGSPTDLFSIGVVMYELLTGQHPFVADNLAAIVHRIANVPHRPVRELRPGLPEIFDLILVRALSKDPGQRYRTGIDLAGDLSLVFDQLSLSAEDISDQEKFNQVRDLGFFRGFSESEIWEVVHASKWERFDPGAAVVTEGDLDPSFYILVSGEVVVRKQGREVYTLGRGECFGEMGFVTRQTRSADVVARQDVHAMRVNASLIERASPECQLRFHKVFLNTLVGRLRSLTDRVIST